MAEDVPGVNRKTIPVVEGMTTREAFAVLRDAGFTPSASRRRFAEGDPTSRVRGSVPPDGAAALVGSRVDLLPIAAHSVSDREPVATPEEQAIAQGRMPNWRGFPWEQAVRFMQGSGFQTPLRFVYAFDVDVDAELVIATDPRAGSALVTDLVVFWILEGPAPREQTELPKPDVPIPTVPPRDSFEPVPQPE